MKLTMKEIADLAKVSQSAVSLTLNGKADGKISKENQKRVWDVIRKYNYRPNIAARKLRQGKVSTIGILMGSPKSTFAAEMISALQIKLEQRGYMALFSFWNTPQNFHKAFENILQHNVDGIISWEYDQVMEKENVPGVLYCCQHKGMDSVLMDFDHAIIEAMKYLKQLGHKKLGFVGEPDDPRTIAFKQRVREMEFECRPEWILNHEGSQQGGLDAVDDLVKLTERPTAIVTMNDSIAYGFHYKAHCEGIRIPEDLSVVSFDNTEYTACMIPPLTTFYLPVEMIADSLIDRIMAKIKYPENPDCNVMISLKLVVRKSCMAPNTGSTPAAPDDETSAKN